MLDRLLKFEEQLARIEALLLVVFLLMMLGLATYNVFYRNVLVPIQVRLITEDEAAQVHEPVAEQPTPDEPKPASPEEKADENGAADGFGGGFGEDEEAGGFGGGFGDAPSEAPEDARGDDAAGFGGGFGDEPADPAEPAQPEAQPEVDDAAGFGGGFGDEAPAADGADGFGGGFGDAPADPNEGFGGGFGDASGGDGGPSDAAAIEVDTEPEPERELPWFAKFVDDVKLEWIDVLLRQLVLVVGFLGAMLATRRRKHITIDALSKLLPQSAIHWTAVLTNTVSVVICALLAKAGSDLVAISIEFPKELVSWADEWQFQLIFPAGFGLLVLHFGIRIVESLYYALGKAEPPEEYMEGGIV